MYIPDQDWKDKQKGLLKEVNESLRPDEGTKTGKVGIFADGQNGDVLTVMSCLKYRDQLFPNKEIIWYINMPYADLLKFAPISEVRPYPWGGYGLPVGSENFYPMLCDYSNNQLNDKYKDYELTADLESGHFPATWSCLDKGNLDYPSISRRHFGFDQNTPWHPYVCFSEEERLIARDFIDGLSPRRNIMLETFGGSGQSHFDHGNTMATIKICREIWGDCNFIFPCPQYLNPSKAVGNSYEYPADLLAEDGVVRCSHFGIRQTALLIDYCDLFVGVSSGIGCATSAWGLKPVPKIQFCGSFKCSTVTLATGEIALVDHGDQVQDKVYPGKPTQRQRYEQTLREMLIKYR